MRQRSATAAAEWPLPSPPESVGGGPQEIRVFAAPQPIASNNDIAARSRAHWTLVPQLGGELRAAEGFED